MAAMEEARSFVEKFVGPLLAGGVAGTTTDFILFPLDTIKTRLQSKKGLRAAGGFHKIYAGIPAAFIASAPTASIFFCTYELTKKFTSQFVHDAYTPMLAATAGEMAASVVRVPFEIVKQRSQTNCHLHPSYIFRDIIATHGPRGLFRGYFCTIARDIPFSLLQYPLWEYLKSSWSSWQGHPTEPWQGAACGSVAGCTAAAITTPLDVAKTRIMLADVEQRLSLPQLMISIGKNGGIKSLFSGLLPRAAWMAIGGFVFLGAYDFTTQQIDTLQNSNLLSSIYT